MKHTRAAVFFILLSLFPALAGADPPVLSLDEAIRLGLERSVDLRSRSLDLAQAAYAANHRWAEVFPAISATAGLSYNTPLFLDPGFQAEKKNLAITASLALDLRMNAGLPQTLKLLILDYRIQLLSYEQARQTLETDLTKKFFSLITGKERVAHLEKMREAAERQREKSRISFENGLTGELTYLRSRLAAENARLNLNTQRTSQATGLREFLALLGIEQTAEAVLEGAAGIAPVELDAETLIAEYLAKRMDVLRQRQAIERLEILKTRTLLTTYAPSFRIYFSTDWKGTLENYSTRPADSLRGEITLTIPVDSFIPGTKSYQTLRAADTGIEQARLALQNTEHNAMNQIRSLTANLRTSWSTVEISRLQVQLAERTYELTEQGFQQGTVEYLTLEDTRNSMSEARQQLLNNELNYLNMVLDLAAALNLDWRELMRSTP